MGAPRRVPARVAAGATLAIVLSACALMTSSPSAVPASLGPSAAPGQSVARDCFDAAIGDIRGPGGGLVLLTGVWRGSDYGRYEVQQDGACVFWLGTSENPGEEPGSNWTNVFIGTIDPTFRINGVWGQVPHVTTGSLLEGRLTLQVEFEVFRGVELPLLREKESSGSGATTWVLENQLPAPAELEGVLGAYTSVQCPALGNEDPHARLSWIEVEGERLELIGLGSFAQDGAPIRVIGRVAPMMGLGCTPSAILISQLDLLN